MEILEACGRLDTNCFELKIDTKDGSRGNLRAMYRLASIMSHNCTPNTKHTFDPDYGINMYATVPIGMHYAVIVIPLGYFGSTHLLFVQFQFNWTEFEWNLKGI